MKLLTKLSKIIPECYLKHKFRCWYYNLTNDEIKMRYSCNHYITTYEGYKIKTHDHIFRELKYIVPFYLKKYKIKENDIIIDAGAYIGGFALLAAMMAPKGKIVAFEPNPAAADKLIENIELNNIKNIIVRRKGLWNEKTTLKFHQDLSPTDSSSASSFILEDNPYITDKDENNTSVEVDTLDNELKKLGISKVDFIKMDIEGSEINAIKGAEETLKNHDVNLAIASYHHFEGKPTHIQLEKELKRFGYDAQTIDSIHTTTYAKNYTMVGDKNE